MTQAPNGIYISEATAEGTRQMFIDHEMIEFAAINAKVRRRLNRQEKEAADRRTAAIKAARKAHRRAKRTAALTAACVLPWIAAAAGLASPILAVIVSVPCFGNLCFRAGRNK